MPVLRVAGVERTERILKGEVSQVVKGLRLIATKRRLRGEQQKAFSRAADYFYANRTRMRYDLYLRRGWPIASGAVEGTCKCLVRDRFERSGMRWSPDMAEAMPKLRGVYLSGDWDAYWEWTSARTSRGSIGGTRGDSSASSHTHSIRGAW